MRIPDQITVRLESPAPTDLSNIIVEIKIRAGRKNPFYIQFPKTDRSGQAVLIREELVGQFTDHWEQGLMDYDGNLDTAEPVVQLSLFDPIPSIKDRAGCLNWPLFKHERTKWASRAEEYEHRITCRNPQFSASPVAVNLELNHVVVLRVVPRRAGTAG